MSISVGTWNMDNALGDPKRQPQALRVCRRIDADVLFLSKAGVASNRASLNAGLDGLRGIGYTTIMEAKGLDRPDGQNECIDVMALKVSTMSIKPMMLSEGCNVMVARVPDAPRIIGVLHTDSISRESRKDVSALQSCIDSMGYDRVVVVGERPVGNRSRLAKTAAMLARMGQLTHVFPLPGVEDYQGDDKRLSRPFSIKYLGGIASGQAIDIYTEAGFKSADDKHHPTTVAYHAKPHYCADHILTKGELQTTDFGLIYPGATGRKPISDHLAIRVRVLS